MNGEQFESEVRRIANYIYADADSVQRESLSDREHDGVIRIEDRVILIEATTRRDKDKIIQDAEKIKKQVQKFRRENCSSKGFIVTKDDPTDHQVGAAKNYSNYLDIISFAQLQAKMFDGHNYLSCRNNYHFGSSQDEVTGQSFRKEMYVEVPLLSYSGESLSVAQLTEQLKNNSCFCIVGEFGIGKSTTLLRIFKSLEDLYRSKKSAICPVFINLRDHAGQTAPSEVLTRHCNAIGFDKPSSLIRAWRAGYCQIILDGFDELSNPGWGMSIRDIRKYRRSAVALVRNFVVQSRGKCAVIASGRDNYFDNQNELVEALGIDNCSILRLSEPGLNIATKILHKLGYVGNYPGWLPRRPLFLAYYATLSAGTSASQELGPAETWDSFLDRLTARESTQNDLLEPASVRRVLERLATIARRSADGLGALNDGEIGTTFKEIIGFEPEGQTMAMILRMCGLKPSPAGDGTRQFIDTDMAGSLQAGDVWRFALNPYDPANAAFPEDAGQAPEITYLMCQLASGKHNISAGNWKAAAAQAEKMGVKIFLLDFFKYTEISNGDFSGIQLTLREHQIECLSFSEDSGDCSGIVFSDCIIGHLEIHSMDTNRAPTIQNCLIGEVSFASDELLQSSKFSGSTYEKISKSSLKNDSILDAPISRQRRVTMTVLNKLFRQAGTSRQRSALYRGLNQSERALVDPVISAIVAEGLAEVVRQPNLDLVKPNRSESPRALRMLTSLGTINDPLFLRVDGI